MRDFTAELHDSFFKDHFNWSTVRTEHAFAAYFVNADTFVCAQIHVHPEHQHGGKETGEGRKLLTAIVKKAVELDCKKVACTIQPFHPTAHPALLAAFAGGFKLKGMTKEGQIYLEMGVA
jgi:hypothetical protein